MYATFKDKNLELRWPIITDGQVTGEQIIPAGTRFEFDRMALLDKIVVDFDPGPDMRVGFYSEDEFARTFDVEE